ncbi:MAG TPA: protein-disulfide reductase DsbD [Gammaproteobacteria bacterium]|nr:protein-disulfide reductase DsbD [Gammaproteobacteria bacterium]
MDRRRIGRHGTRLIGFALLGVLAVQALPAFASGNYGRFLPPDQAFVFSSKAVPGAVQLHWKIADGYYLYKRQFKVMPETGQLGKVDFPHGDVENDPNFGPVVVYHHQVTLRVPVTGLPASGMVKFKVTYQGCAESGLCYAPMHRVVSLRVPPAAPASAPAGSVRGGPGGVAAGGPASEQSRLAALVQHANPFWFVVVFFGLGVLLSFTPCVLPMIPILAGIIGGESAGISTRRGMTLSLVYVLSMALVYTGLGVAAGFAGTGLQAIFQAPWIIALFAAIFVLLAGGLFGFYELRLPAALTSRVAALSGRQRGGTWTGVVFMGALSALIVSPCVAAPLAGALIVIGQAGEPIRGGIALFALALGMGAPLVIYGALAGRLLPRAGGWMTDIQRLLGIAMLAYAVWLLSRIVPAPLTLVLYGLVGLLAAAVLGLFTRLPETAGKGASLGRALAVAVFVWALALIVGGAAGGHDPLRPLAPLAGLSRGKEAQAVASSLNYQNVKSLDGLQMALADAARQGRPVMVDFYADWCTSCLEMEHTTLRNSEVRSALAQFRLLKVDVTEDSAENRALLKRYGLYGPPAFIFYDAQGRHLKADTVVGYEKAVTFMRHLQRALPTS